MYDCSRSGEGGQWQGGVGITVAGLVVRGRSHGDTGGKGSGGITDSAMSSHGLTSSQCGPLFPGEHQRGLGAALGSEWRFNEDHHFGG